MYHTMKKYEEVEISLHTFIPWASPRSLISIDKAPHAHWTEGWVGQRSGLDAVGKKKQSVPVSRTEPRSPTCGPVIIRTQLSRINWRWSVRSGALLLVGRELPDLRAGPSVFLKWSMHPATDLEMNFPIRMSPLQSIMKRESGPLARMGGFGATSRAVWLGMFPKIQSEKTGLFRPRQ